MDTLLEDYKRKLKSINELISKQRTTVQEERLITKAAEYSTFIVDIERAMARQQQQNVRCANVSDTLLLKAQRYEDAANADIETEGVQHNLNLGRYDGLMIAVQEITKSDTR